MVGLSVMLRLRVSWRLALSIGYARVMVWGGLLLGLGLGYGLLVVWFRMKIPRKVKLSISLRTDHSGWLRVWLNVRLSRVILDLRLDLQFGLGLELSLAVGLDSFMIRLSLRLTYNLRVMLQGIARLRVRLWVRLMVRLMDGPKTMFRLGLRWGLGLHLWLIGLWLGLVLCLDLGLAEG